MSREMQVKNLLSSWAKSPFLNGANVLIAGSCVKDVYPEIFEKFAQDKVVLLHCPECEQPIFGKLASMLTSTKPKSITVLTVDCSPHCYTLHAAVNEAYYIAKLKDDELPRRHFVILEGQVNEVSPAAIRLSRYLSLTQRAVEKMPELLEELSRYSLEHKSATRREK